MGNVAGSGRRARQAIAAAAQASMAIAAAAQASTAMAGAAQASTAIAAAALVSTACGLFLLLCAAAGPGTAGDSAPIVVLGSSTAAGVGPSDPDSAWVARLQAVLGSLDTPVEVVNLAVGGYTTYHLMPQGQESPPGRPEPDTLRNMTAALSRNPRAIIVNLPSNDTTYGFSIQEQLANYAAMREAAESCSVPVWFTTTQPRNLQQQAMRDDLEAMTDSTIARYGEHAIDFWSALAAQDGTILPGYDCGDGIHLNDAGHRLLWTRVMEAEILSQTTPGEPDPGRP